MSPGRESVEADASKVLAKLGENPKKNQEEIQKIEILRDVERWEAQTFECCKCEGRRITDSGKYFRAEKF